MKQFNVRVQYRGVEGDSMDTTINIDGSSFSDAIAKVKERGFVLWGDPGSQEAIPWHQIESLEEN